VGAARTSKAENTSKGKAIGQAVGSVREFLQGCILEALEPRRMLTAVPTSAGEIDLFGHSRVVHLASFPGDSEYQVPFDSATNTFRDTGLQAPLAAGTTYQYTEFDDSQSGETVAANDTVTTRPSSGAISAPSLNVVSANEIDVSWDSIGVGSGSYALQRSSDGANFTTVASIGADAGTYQDIGLSHATAYYYQIVDVAEPSASDASLAVTQGPPAPYNLTASQVDGSGTTTLNWQGPWNDYSSVHIELSTDGTNFSEVTQVGPGATSASVGGLSPGQTYNFRVWISDYTTGLNSDYSNVASLVPQPPQAPSNLIATPVGSSGTTTLSWQGSWSSSSIHIEMSTDGTTFNEVAETVSYQDGSYQVGGLSASQTYYFRTWASDWVTGLDSGDSNVATLSPYVPPTPGNLTATPVDSSGNTTLNWQGGPWDSNDSMHIELSTDNVNFTEIAQGNPNNMSQQVGNGQLSAGQTYYFRIWASNPIDGLDSGDSNVVTVVSQAPAAPYNLTASPIDPSGNTVLNWQGSDSGYSSVHIELSTDGTNFTEISQAGPGATSAPVSGLIPTSNYYFRVWISDYTTGLNSADSNIALAVPYVPATPVSLSATVPTYYGNGPTLTWRGGPWDSQDVMHLEASPDGVNFSEVATASADGLVGKIPDGVLSSGQPYVFRVRASSAAGIYSDYSQIAAATVPVPSNLSTSSVGGSGDVTLTWQGTGWNDAYESIHLEMSTDGVNFSEIAQGYPNSMTEQVGNGSLLTAQTYYFRAFVATDDLAYRSGYSNVVIATPQAPPAPSGLTATAVDGYGSSTLNWQSAWNTYSSVHIELSTDGVNFTEVTQAGTGAVSATVYGLSSTQTYYFRTWISDYTTGLNSGYSNVAVLDVPATPTGLTATPVDSGGTSTLSWQGTWDQYDSVHVQISTDGSNWGFVTEMNASQLSTSVIGLSPSQTYYFQVWVSDSASGLSSVYSTITLSPVVPATPVNLSATQVDGSGNTTLTWQGSWDSNDSLHIELSTDNVNFSEIAEGNPDALSQQVGSGQLSPNTPYYLRIWVSNPYDGQYSGDSNVVRIGPSAPPDPYGLTASAIDGTGTTTLNWQGPYGGYSSVHVEMSTDGTDFSEVTQAGPDGTSAQVSGLTASQTYYFRVWISDYTTGLNSGDSNVAIIAPVGPATPINLSATPVDVSGNTTLNWQGGPWESYDSLHVQISTDSINFSEIAQGDPNAMSLQVGNGQLSQSQIYYFKIWVSNPINGLNSGGSNIANTGMDAPENLIATPFGSEIDLLWTGSAPQYEVLRGSNPSDLTQIGGTNSHSFHDTAGPGPLQPGSGVGLEPNTNYYYRVIADYGSGNTFAADLSASTAPLTISSVPSLNVLGGEGAVTTIGFNTNDFRPFGSVVDWGDGTVTSGSLTALPVADSDPHQQYLSGSHVYAEEGQYQVTATLTDASGESRSDTFVLSQNDASLTPTGDAITATAEVPFNGAVADFTDAAFQTSGPPDQFNPADYSALIDWGDGDKTAAAISPDGTGGYTVAGAHTYATAGPRSVVVTILDEGGAAATITDHATVDANPDAIVVAPLDVSPVQDQGFYDTIATFTDARPGTNASDYIANIDWGDGTQGNGLVSSDGSGNFLVSANGDVLLQQGDFTGTVTITHVPTATTSTPVHMAVTVLDAGIDVNGVGISATAGQSFSGEVATFNDGDPNGSVGQFHAVILWGDGGVSDGTITSLGGSQFEVDGNYTYSVGGNPPVSVEVFDSGGAATTGGSSADVQGQPPDAPQDLAVSAVSPTEALVTWAPSDGATGYDIYRTDVGQIGSTSDGQSITFDDSTLQAHTDYTYYVVANNDWGSSPDSGSVDLHTPNTPPVAQDDGLANEAQDPSFSVLHDQPLDLPVDTLLSNDYDPDGDPITINESSLGSTAQGGTVSLVTENGVQSVKYTPAEGFVGVDNFTYTVSDGIDDSKPAYVTVKVTNAPPEAQSATYTVPQAQDSNGNWLLKGAPVEGDASAYDPDPRQDPNDPNASDSDGDGDASGEQLTYILVNGIPSGDGTLDFNTETGHFKFTPSDSFQGNAEFTFKVNDGVQDSNLATVTFRGYTIEDDEGPEGETALDGDELTQTDLPSVYNGNHYSLIQGQQLKVDAPGLLAGAGDDDGETVTVVPGLVESPQHGQLTALNPGDGSFTYVPDDNFVGRDWFTYRVTDGGTDSGMASVFIDVQPVKVDLVVSNLPPESHPTPDDSTDPAALIIADNSDPDQDGIPEDQDTPTVGDDANLVPMQLLISQPLPEGYSVTLSTTDSSHVRVWRQSTDQNTGNVTYQELLGDGTNSVTWNIGANGQSDMPDTVYLQGYDDGSGTGAVTSSGTFTLAVDAGNSTTSYAVSAALASPNATGSTTKQVAKDTLPFDMSLANILMDTNRDGTVNNSDNTNKDKWTGGPTGQGAIILPNSNIDPMNTTGAPDNWTGGFFNGVDVPANNVVDGPNDLNDMGDLMINQLGSKLPDGATITLSVSKPTDDEAYFSGLYGAADRIRIFAPTKHGRGYSIAAGDKAVIGPGTLGSSVTFVGTPLAGSGQLSSDMFKGTGSLDFKVEGIVPGARVLITLTITQGTTQLYTSTVQMKVAPFVLQSNADKIDRSGGKTVFVNNAEPNGLPDLKNFLTTNPLFAGITATDSGADVWEQDGYEIGYAQAPGAGGTAISMPLVMELPRAWNRGTDLRDFVESTLLTEKLGVFRVGSGTSGYDYGGDIESIPVTGKAGYFFHGSTTTAPNPTVANFINAQGVNTDLQVDTTWLEVGHVDEIVSPASDGKHVVVADPDTAIGLLLYAKYLGVKTPFFQGLNGNAAGDTVTALLGRLRPGPGPGHDLGNANADVNAHLNTIRSQLATKLGLTEPLTVPVPAATNKGTGSLIKGGALVSFLNKKRTYEIRFTGQFQYDFYYSDDGGASFVKAGSGIVQSDQFFPGFGFILRQWWTGNHQVGDKFDYTADPSATIVNMPVLFFGTPKTATGGGYIAYSENNVNSLIDGTAVVTEKTFGPVNKGTDVFQNYVAWAFFKAGYAANQTFFVDASGYHNWDGEIHCGTNAERAIIATPWWKLAQA
jgi:hypothetical protein